MSQKYRFRRKPYQHQVEGLKKLLSTGFGGALLCQPRTGKTKIAVDYLGVQNMKGRICRAVVIAPNGVLDVWIEELAVNLPVPHRVILWDRQGRRDTPLPRPRAAMLDIIVINYDAFSTPGAKMASGRRSRKRGGKYSLVKALQAWAPDCVILDESHRIKSANGAKSRMIVKLGKEVKYRLILTGTPVTKAKRTHDVFAQWKFLNPQRFEDYPTLDEFKHHYGVWTNRNGFPQLLRPQNVLELRKRIHLDSFAITREECYDLPPRLPDQIIHVPLDRSGPAYDDMAEDMIAKLRSGEITTASIKLVQVLRLAQITSGLAKTEPSEEHPEGRLVRIGREKLLVAEELLSDWMEAEEKVVIAARFRADIASLAKLCREKLKVPTNLLVGGMGAANQGQAWRSFQARPGPAVIVCQPQVASLGIELGSAATMLWYSLTSSWVDFQQMCDRVALSNRAVCLTFLLGEGTVDEIMYKVLQEDGKIAEAIVRNPERLRR